jgi:hypothetical protein
VRGTLRLEAVHNLDTCRPTVTAELSTPLGHLLLRIALIVVVLGVLPFLLDADPLWQLFGVLVSVVMSVRGAQLIWRGAFSTHPRHMSRH